MPRMCWTAKDRGGYSVVIRWLCFMRHNSLFESVALVIQGCCSIGKKLAIVER